MALSKKIQATMIFEIIGRPAENLVTTLEGIIKQIDNEKGVTVTAKDIKKPVIMKDQKDLYTTFAEIELEVEEAIILAILMFKYMPAHIDVVSPESINISNHNFGDLLSELTRRLHAYDEVARVLEIKNAELQKKVKELTPEKEVEKTKKEEKK